MIKKSFFVVLFFFFVSTAHAQTLTINYTDACSDGGQIFFSGSWHVLTGEFSFGITMTDCKENNNTFNGTGTSSGTYSAVTSALRASATLESTVTSSDGGSGTIDCTIIASGIYNAISSEFNGTSSTRCSSSGTVSVSLNKILSGKGLTF